MSDGIVSSARVADEFGVEPPEDEVLRHPPDRPVIDDATSERLQRRHLGHLAAIKEAGHLMVAGPLLDQPDDTWRGIAVYQVGSLEEARRLAESDPTVRAGIFSVDVMHWYTRKGALLTS